MHICIYTYIFFFSKIQFRRLLGDGRVWNTMNAGCEALIKVHPPAPTIPYHRTKTLILFSVVARAAHPRELEHISALADISPCFEVAGGVRGLWRSWLWKQAF